jgi:hypothetical protein
MKMTQNTNVMPVGKSQMPHSCMPVKLPQQLLGAIPLLERKEWRYQVTVTVV